LAAQDAPPAPRTPNPYDALAAGPDPGFDGQGFDGRGFEGHGFHAPAPGPAPDYPCPPGSSDHGYSAEYGAYGPEYGTAAYGAYAPEYGTGPAPHPEPGAPTGPEPEEAGLLGLNLRADDEEFEPENRSVANLIRRRRRSRLRRTAKVAIALTVLLAFLVVGDRYAAFYAEDKAATKVQRSLKLHAQPEVHIKGFPFLTQLASDRLDNVDVTIPDVPAGRVSVAQVKGSVHDVRIVGGDAPTTIRGAVLGRMHGDVLLDFDDLDRELGTSQVKFTHGGDRSTVLASGRLPVAGEQVKVRARAHLKRESDHGVGTTVDDMRLDVPGLFSYLPGKHGGIRLARPLARRIQHDAAKVRSLFRIGTVAKRFGLTPERARKLRYSERELHRLTGEPLFVDKLMKVNMLDVLIEHPELLKKVGIDPGLIEGLKKLQVPKLAQKLSLSTQLPKLPGDVRLRDVSVAKEGIRARVTGVDVPFGKGARDQIR